MVLSLRGSGFGPGELITLASAAVWGLHVVLLSRWSVPGHALRLACVQTGTVSAMAFLTVLADAGLTGGSPPPALPADGPTWASVVFLAVLATAAAMVLLSWSQARVGAVILTLEPAVAGVTAVATGVALTARTALGASLLLAAVFVVELGRPPDGEEAVPRAPTYARSADREVRRCRGCLVWLFNDRLRSLTCR